MALFVNLVGEHCLQDAGHGSPFSGDVAVPVAGGIDHQGACEGVSANVAAAVYGDGLGRHALLLQPLPHRCDDLRSGPATALVSATVDTDEDQLRKGHRLAEERQRPYFCLLFVTLFIAAREKDSEFRKVLSSDLIQ